MTSARTVRPPDLGDVELRSGPPADDLRYSAFVERTASVDAWHGYVIEVPGEIAPEQAEAWREAFAREKPGPVILMGGARLRHLSEWQPQMVVAPPPETPFPTATILSIAAVCFSLASLLLSGALS